MQFIIHFLTDICMKTKTSVHWLHRPAAHAAAWPLLAITKWLIGFISATRALALAQVNQAMQAVTVTKNSGAGGESDYPVRAGQRRFPMRQFDGHSACNCLPLSTAIARACL